MSKIDPKKVSAEEAAKIESSKPKDPWGYKKWEDLDVETDSDDCHPNIEIGTWRRLKERMRNEKGIKKKELQIKDKWNTTSMNKNNIIDVHKKLDTSENLKKNNNNNNNNDNNIDNDNDNNNNNNNNDKKISNNNEINNDNNNKLSENNNEINEQKMEKNGNNKNVKSKKDNYKANNNSNNDKEINKKSGDDVKSKNDEDGIYKARSDPQTFLDKNMELLKEFAKIKNDLKANNFIKKNYDIVHEASEGYLITYAVDRAVEGASDKELRKLAKRCLMVHNLVQSCSQANISPEKGVEIFYKRLNSGNNIMKQYEDELDIQCNELMERIYQRKKERLAEADQQHINEQEVEYEEIDAPLGPGGLDPTEVLNSLPKAMQEAFIDQDIPKLKEVLAKMSDEDASYHMDRCVKAGLWVTNADDDDENNNNNNKKSDDIDESGDKLE